MKHSLFAASLLALAVTAPAAQAFEAGDIVVRAGAVRVDPNVDSGHIKHEQLGSIAGSKATVNSNTQLGLNFAYFVTDEVAIELLAATPFKHNLGVKGMPGALSGLNGKLGTTKHLPPTISANYYPMARTGSNFQPYIGIGVNYTNFFSTSLSSSAESKGFESLSLKNSWGIAGQLGVDYMLTDNLMLNAQARYINIDTTATTRLAGEKVKVDVDIDPAVYMIGLGYKF